MYTSFVTLSDIDNRRRKTNHSIVESSSKHIISLGKLKQCIRERNENLFNEELDDIIKEASINTEVVDDIFANLVNILSEGVNVGFNVDSSKLIPIIPCISGINKVNDLLSKSSMTITESLSNTITKNKIASRILNNYNIIKEEVDINPNIKPTEDYIMEFCESFDNAFVNMEQSKKMILCIESLSYIFDKNYIQYNTEDVVNTVTDYFIFVNENKDDFESVYNRMAHNLKVLCNECKGFNTDRSNIYLLNESENYADSDDVKKALDSFKKDTNKSYSKLKQIILKLYTKSPKQVIDDMPNVLHVIRYLIILGGTGISPLLGLVTLCVDKFIQMKLSREYAEKMYNHFKKEKEDAKKKLDKLESGTEKYKNAESYYNCLDKCLDKIHTYKNSLYSEKELEDSDDDYYSDSDDIDDFDFGDFNFDESTSLTTIADNTITFEEFKGEYFDYIMNDIATAKNIILDVTDKMPNRRFELEDTSWININDISSIMQCINCKNEFVTIIGYIQFSSEEDFEDINSILYQLKPNLKYTIAFYSCPVNGFSAIKIKFPKSIIFSKEYDDYHNEHTMLNEDLNRVAYIKLLENYITELEETYSASSMDDILKSNMKKITEASPMKVSDIIIGLGDIVNHEQYIHNLNEIKKHNHDSILNTDIACAIGILEDTSDLNLDEIHTLEIQKESAKIITDIINEKVDIASLKVAGINLMNKAKQLSNKEKEVSRSFDLSMTKIKDSVEKAMTNDRREAIIKGSIIPSASKCIKLAITTGAAYLVSPTLAIIGVLGGLAISKGLNKRERSILLDEIEVELKVVEKEISMAESDGDTKKYKQLLLYQNKLRKEAQRIRYNIKSAGYDANVTVGLAKGKDDD